jgi:predicted nucleotide-binding protein
LRIEVDFAAFAFARDDWTTTSRRASAPTGPGQASPRDNVVFEAGLFGGTLGMRRTFILHASDAKLPSDLGLLIQDGQQIATLI